MTKIAPANVAQPLEIKIIGAVLLVYAVFGSPTPDYISWPEILQAVGLAALVLLAWVKAKGSGLLPSYAYAFWFTFAVGLGSSFGNDPGQIIRDITAHLFLGLGVLWAGALREQDFRFLMTIMGLAGAIIAFRFLLQTGFSVSAMETKTKFNFDGFLKLNTDPLVTFSAAYGLMVLAKFKEGRSLAVKAMLFICSAISILAIGISSLRGPAAIIVIAICYTLLQARRPTDRAPLIILVGFLAVMASEFFLIFSSNLINKTMEVGASGKIDEFIYVMRTAGFDFYSTLLGSGFGSFIDVGSRQLSFTHSAISYYYARTGLAGVFVFVLFLVDLSIQLVKRKMIFRSEIFLLYIILLYGLLVNPHYKYLTFGLILAICVKSLGLVTGADARTPGAGHEGRRNTGRA